MVMNLFLILVLIEVLQGLCSTSPLQDRTFLSQSIKCVNLCTQLKAYTNADWPGHPNDRCSTTGFVIFLGDALFSWSSKKQHTMSRSSTGAEYSAMATTTVAVIWIQQLSGICIFPALLFHFFIVIISRLWLLPLIQYCTPKQRTLRLTVTLFMEKFNKRKGQPQLFFLFLLRERGYD